MNIKTINNFDQALFDAEVSKNSIELNAKFTQTHVTNVGGRVLYTAILFYE